MTMKKKWLIVMLVVLALAAVCCAVIGILTDPFGLFDDPAADWDDEAGHPGYAKIVWLKEHHSEYDSYLIGSADGSYDVEELNDYLGASFYDLTVLQGDAGDYRDLAAYVLKRYPVKNLVLNLGIDEFAAMDAGEDGPGPGTDPAVIAGTGSLDRSVEDVEKIGDLSVYEEAHAGEFPAPAGTERLSSIDECVQMVKKIRDLCRVHGAELTVISAPVHISRWAALDEASLRACKTALAGVVDFWDFSCTPISYDSRYFYDPVSFRGAVGSMILAEIFGNGDVYRPERFGALVTAENCGGYLDELFSDPPTPEAADYTADLPILLYHHIAEDQQNFTTVSPEAFERQMRFLAENGYHAVTLQEMIDYVYHGGELPDKPVCITFDDGYLSNYEYAWPVLEHYGLNAVIYAIGVSVGHTEFYKDTEFRLTPHFSYEQAREMMASGAVDVQSHTYDMHQWAPFETGDRIRQNILPLEGEDASAYAEALRGDIDRYDEIARKELGRGFVSIAYPGGAYVTLTEVLVHQAGIPVTMSTRTDSRNVLVRGLPQSLYALCRWYMNEDTTPEEMWAVLDGAAS